MGFNIRNYHNKMFIERHKAARCYNQIIGNQIVGVRLFLDIFARKLLGDTIQPSILFKAL